MEASAFARSDLFEFVLARLHLIVHCVKNIGDFCNSSLVGSVVDCPKRGLAYTLPSRPTHLQHPLSFHKIVDCQLSDLLLPKIFWLLPNALENPYLVRYFSGSRLMPRGVFGKSFDNGGVTL